MDNYKKILVNLRKSWTDVPAASDEDMWPIKVSSGEESAEAFIGIRPIDVDIESSGFLPATPLFDLPPRAAAAYLGTYLIFLLTEYGVQKTIGFSTDVFNRAHVITFLTSVNFWSDYGKPHLNAKCIDVLGEIIAFMIENSEDFLLDKKDLQQLNLLIRSITIDQKMRKS